MAERFDRDRDSSVERREGPSDRRTMPSQWVTPQFWLNVGLAVIMVGSFYVLGERRTSTLEAAATNLTEKANRMEGQVVQIGAAVQTVSLTTTELKAKVEALSDANRDIREANRMLEARLISMEKAIAKLEAKSNQ